MPDDNETSTAAPAPSATPWILLWTSIVIIVYGSLFPFNFISIPKPLSDFYKDWNLFKSIPDAIDNFFLFVPLGIALHACYPKLKSRILVGCLLLLVLAVGLQLVQLYIPSRTSSVADSIWNIGGTLVGSLVGAIFWKFVLARLPASNSSHNRFGMLLMLVWFTYESYPFVPTLDLGLLKAHVKPLFLETGFDASRFLQHQVAAILGGVAICRANLLKTRFASVLWAGGLTVFLEVFVAYGALHRETVLGALSGLAVGYAIDKSFHSKTQYVVFGLAACAYLFTVSTPYRGQVLNPGFVWTPFSTFLWHTNLKEIPPLAFEALSIGAMYWAFTLDNDRLHQRKIWDAFLVFSLVVLMEPIRVFGFSIQGDSSTIVMAALLGAISVSFRVQMYGYKPGTSSRPAPTILKLVPTPNQTILQIANAGYLLAVLAFIAYVGMAGFAKATQPEWVIFWCVMLSFMLLAHQFPILGLFVFIVVGYGISSNGPQYDNSLAIRLRDGIALLALAASLISVFRVGRTFHWRHSIAYTGIALFVWLGVCVISSIAQGTPWGPVLRFDPSNYLQATTLFFVVLVVLKDKKDHEFLAYVTICTVLGRAIVQGIEGVYLESYVATLLVITLPLCGVGFSRPFHNKLPTKIFLGIFAVAMFGFLLIGQNRNSGVAAAVVIVFAIVQMPGIWWKKLALLTVATLAISFAAPQNYKNRFEALWHPKMSHKTAGLDQGTAEARLKLWDFAWKLSKEHPVVGVGPGNFAHWLKNHVPGAGRQGAHNSYLQMLAETGWVGLFLYGCFFTAVFLALEQTRRSDRLGWRGGIAKWLQLSIIGYLMLGIFNNRNDLVLAYIFAGWAVTLQIRKAP